MSSATRTRKSGHATKILASLAVLAFAGAMFTVGSLALFTDQQDVSGNAFTAGTVDLVASPASAVLTMPAMAPGDQVTAPMTVTNSGTIEFRYALSSTTTEDVLASQLQLTVKSGVTTCDDANWSATGVQLYQGILGSTTTAAIFGSSAQGAQAGDRVIAGGANEALCFNVRLPMSASNASQGTSTSATFTFDAEQTANNP